MNAHGGTAYRPLRWIAAAAIAAVVAVVAIAWRGGADTPSGADDSGPLGVSPFDLLAASVDETFPQPPSRWPFEFPADHASHDDYRTEWWYLSGTLQGADGSPTLGAQWLLMRIGLRGTGDAGTVAESEPAEDASAWRTSQIYAGLFSISAPSGGLRADGRLSRGAVGLAGADAQPVRIWIESWQLAEQARGAAPQGFTLHLNADAAELQRELHAAKPVFTAGDLTGPGGASASPFQFYPQPRLEARGALVADGRRIEVDGVFSFEHAWGELPLPGGPVGNDRFALHLDDGSELILLHTHRTRAGGARTASTSGLLIDSAGAAVALAGDDVVLEPLAHWTSPRTGTRYRGPAG